MPGRETKNVTYQCEGPERAPEVLSMAFRLALRALALAEQRDAEEDEESCSSEALDEHGGDGGNPEQPTCLLTIGNALRRHVTEKALKAVAALEDRLDLRFDAERPPPRNIQ